MNKHAFRLVVAFAVIALASIAYFAFVQKTPVTTSETGSESLPPTETSSGNGDATESATLTLKVNWSAPVTVAPVDIFAPAYKGEGEIPDAWLRKNFANPENYRRVGTVVGGSYDGVAIVVVGVLERCSMGDYSTNYEFLVPKDGKPVLLAKHSPQHNKESLTPVDDPCATFDAEKYIVDRDAYIPDLVLPKTLTQGRATLSLTLSGLWNAVAPQIGTPTFDPKGKTLAFTDPVVGEVYTDAPDAVSPMHGFYVSAPDGTTRTYVLDIPFYDAAAHIPRLTWVDGRKNTDEYWSTEIGGCGSRNLVAVVKGVTKSDLKVAGKTEQGEDVYVFADANHQVLKSIYDGSYSLGRTESDRLSYEEFVAAKPVFLWYDALGRLIRFQHASFLPAAECGKPVIYLYPEQTTDVSVKLEPQGGFTVTEPAYDGGWNVRATPKGELTNLKDGKTYPYLFWEGRGGLYETPKRGFVVAEKNVHGFLLEKLAALGLNAQESADFIEFWEPRMTGSPYYFVTFLGNSAMDALAPLDVTPKPDTVIRVLMDFSPLEKPISVEGFSIHTPKREGFTLVEWGGVLR